MSKGATEQSKESSSIFVTQIEDAHRGLIVEEYKALRAESLRCAQTVSTTVWVGITGFFVTAGASVAATSFVRDYDSLLQVTLIFLVLQALGASVMFLSDYWKYVRIGIYIRTKIEEQFKTPLMADTRLPDAEPKTWRPINWEHWIQGKRRAGWFPLISLFVLQLPAITTFVLGLCAAPTLMTLEYHLPDSLLLVQAGMSLTNDLSLGLVLALVWALDVAVVIAVAHVVYREITEETGEKLVLAVRVLTQDPR